MPTREFGTDPYGIIARGVPGGNAGSPVSVGSVGTPVTSLVNPGQTFGTGVGVSYRTSFGGSSGGTGRAGTIPVPSKTRTGNEKTLAKGGKVKKMAKGGSTASKRADGCATKGKTKGRFV